MATLQNIVFITTFAGLALSIAIILLIISQLWNDAKSLAFAGVTSAVAGVTFMSCLLQFSFQAHSTNLNPQTLLELLCIPLFGLPLFLFIFTVEYLLTWTRALRIIGVVYVFQFLISVLVLLSHKWLYDVHFKPDGAIVYSTSTSVPLLLMNAWLTAHTWYVFFLFAKHIRKQSRELDRGFVLGIVLIYAGILFNSINVIGQYSIGTDFLVCGILVLTRPVLKQRLFDPLSQLNRRLEHRAQQFGLITRVGHQAHAGLTRDTLLPEIAHEIQQAFGYTSVQVAVYRDGEQCIAFGMCDAQGRVYNKLDAVSQAALDNRLCLPGLDIPLDISPPDSNSALTGKLRVQAQQISRFTIDEQEALHILAQQIGLAIHNAQLFEFARNANEAKTNFISYVSHELRNAVGNVIALSDNVVRHPEDHNDDALPGSYEDDVSDILKIGQYVKELLDDIVDLGQLESGNLKVEMQPINPLPILQDALQNMMSCLKKGVELCGDFGAELPLVNADDTQLKQVLINLLGNALKFTEHGTVTLTARADVGYLHVMVADTGRGIARHAQPHLFQAYSQESREVFRTYGGSGLGLGISKQLIEQQGGSIWFESKEGVGTTFHFTLPLSEPRTG